MSSIGAAGDDTPAPHLAPLALAIPILHAAKYPTSTVLGVFLGPPQGSSSQEAQAALALPLVHREPALSPMTELAVEHAAAYARQAQRRIVGVYTAGGSVASGGSGAAGPKGKGKGAAVRLLEHVRQVVAAGAAAGAGGEVWGVCLDIPPLSDAPCTATLFSGSTPLLLADLDTARIMPLVRRDKVHRRLNDFDDHLDDANADWTNAALLSEISRQLA